MKTAFLILSLMLLPLLSFSQGTPLILKESDGGKTFTFSPSDKGKRIHVELYDNSGSTGYQWEAKDYNEALIRFADKTYTPPAVQMPGAGGTSVFIFELTGKKGNTPITLKLNRPFDKEDKSGREVSYNILIKSGKKKKK